MDAQILTRSMRFEALLLGTLRLRALMRGDLTDDECAVTGIISELQITADEIMTMLAQAEAPATPSLTDAKVIADHCTLYTIDRQASELERKTPNRSREATKATSTLRRVLPSLIEEAKRDMLVAAAPRIPDDEESVVKFTALVISGAVSTPELDGYRALLSAVTDQRLSFDRSTSLDRWKRRRSWHSPARGLAGLYRACVDQDCGWSRHGAAVTFIVQALERVGFSGTITPEAVEKMLLRKGPDANAR